MQWVWIGLGLWCAIGAAVAPVPGILCAVFGEEPTQEELERASMRSLSWPHKGVQQLDRAGCGYDTHTGHRQGMRLALEGRSRSADERKP